jgi:hypothetical protein
MGWSLVFKAADRRLSSIVTLRSRCPPFGSRLGWRKHEGETHQLAPPIGLRLAGQFTQTGEKGVDLRNVCRSEPPFVAGSSKRSCWTGNHRVAPPQRSLKVPIGNLQQPLDESAQLRCIAVRTKVIGKA